ncbi:MAG TPA: hypothetical protein VJ647_03250 [Chitinophagaceae bacterium]|nr:hypothetical protein [Chitinophagaceae bacterium]
MKLVKFVFATVVIALSGTAYSQTDTIRNPTDTIRPGKPDTTMLTYNNSFAGINNDYNYNNGITVADTIVKPDTAKTSYNDVNPATAEAEANNNTQTQTVVNQPNFGRYYIPVLGSYTSSAQTEEQNKNVTIQGDEQNPGKIWIEGLTTEKIYALRKTNAGTYKIPAQKISDNSKEVRICIGRKFVDSNPSEAFNVTEETTVKKKNQKAAAPVISFTGTKADAGTARM